MPTVPRLRLAIVGSGIGGLSLAVALGKLGLDKDFEINIYEAAAELAQVGAGITIWPRAWDILQKLGLEKPLSERSPPSAAALEGKQVAGFSYRKSDQKEGIPIVDVKLPGGPRAFHRADIQEVLLDNTSSSIRFHFCYRLEKYVKTSIGIELVFSNGSREMCDLLIGSDGINSAVCKAFLEEGNGDKKHSRPKWTGSIVYHGLVKAESIKMEAPNHPGLHSPIVYCGKNKHIVMYPIMHGRYINTIQFISDPRKEGSYVSGPEAVNFSEDDVASMYMGWEDDVQCVVKHLHRPSKWAIHTAHAMAPHLGNGAAQAIEDAYILANLLAKGRGQGQYPRDFSRITDVYNHVHQPFANFVVNATRQQGHRYELNIPSFDDIEEGSTVHPAILTELGKLIEKGWEWTWKTSAQEDLDRALKML